MLTMFPHHPLRGRCRARKLRALALAAPLAALLAVPATSAASVNFGAKLHNQDGTVRQPANSQPGHTCDESGNNDPTPPCTHVAVQYVDGGAVGGHITAPKTGWITSIRVIAGEPGTLRFKLVKVHNLGAGAGTGKGQVDTVGPKVQVQGLGANDPMQIESFKVHMRVHKGDYLAVDSSSISIVTCESGSNEQLLFTPVLHLGNPFASTSTADDCTMLIQATIA
jgi:hypothetical protein